MQKLNISEILKTDAIFKALVSDLSWWLKEIIFPIRYLKDILTAWVAYDGSSFKWINKINNSDSILMWVEETLVKIPETIQDTEKDEYWIICNIYWTWGKPHSNCARSKLLELQKELSEKWDGWELYMWSEPEAFFIEKKEEIWKDTGWNSNYFNPRDSKSFLIIEFLIILAPSLNDWTIGTPELIKIEFI